MKPDILTQILAHVNEGLAVHESHGHAERIGHMHSTLEAIKALIEGNAEPESKPAKPDEKGTKA